MGNQPCLKAAAYTGQHSHTINADRHSCLEWDSNPRSQRAKTFLALDCAATVIGIKISLVC
jgi:hypothetical protein